MFPCAFFENMCITVIVLETQTSLSDVPAPASAAASDTSATQSAARGALAGRLAAAPLCVQLNCSTHLLGFPVSFGKSGEEWSKE